VYVPKKHESVFVNHQPSQNVRDLLAESEKAIREGNSQHAYELSVKATEAVPQSIEAWLLRATLARSLEERLNCVNRLNELAPGYRDKYNVAFFALKEFLDQNPFLRYLEETDELYRVISADRLVLSIPKQRAPANPPPPDGTHANPLRGAYRWLTMAILGLLLAGLGTVVFAPLAAVAALRVQGSAQAHPERVKSTVVVIVAVGLFMIGVIFSLLFILHWLG
jgi:hypothetical protein